MSYENLPIKIFALREYRGEDKNSREETIFDAIKHDDKELLGVNEKVIRDWITGSYIDPSKGVAKFTSSLQQYFATEIETKDFLDQCSLDAFLLKMKLDVTAEEVRANYYVYVNPPRKAFTYLGQGEASKGKGLTGSYKIVRHQKNGEAVISLNVFGPKRQIDSRKRNAMSYIAELRVPREKGSGQPFIYSAIITNKREGFIYIVASETNRSNNPDLMFIAMPDKLDGVTKGKLLTVAQSDGDLGNVPIGFDIEVSKVEEPVAPVFTPEV